MSAGITDYNGSFGARRVRGSRSELERAA